MPHAINSSGDKGLPKVYFEKKEVSDYIRYRNGKWIPYRKRLYLYWYNFLQEAEKNRGYQVDWSKYNGWGGSNVILGQKFDMWWEERWEELFGLEKKGSKQKFPLTTKRPKTEAIRLSLLCWKYRNIKPETRVSVYRGKKKTIVLGNSIRVARAVYQYESGISGDRKPRTPEDEFSGYNLNPDSHKKVDTYIDESGRKISTEYEDDEISGTNRQILQSKIGRYLSKSKKTVSNVSKGMFP